MHWSTTRCQGASRETEIQFQAFLNHPNGFWKILWLVPPLGLPESIQPRSGSRNRPGSFQVCSLLMAPTSSTQVPWCQPAPVTESFWVCFIHWSGCDFYIPTLCVLHQGGLKTSCCGTLLVGALISLLLSSFMNFIDSLVPLRVCLGLGF